MSEKHNLSWYSPATGMVDLSFAKWERINEAVHRLHKNPVVEKIYLEGEPLWNKEEGFLDSFALLRIGTTQISGKAYGKRIGDPGYQNEEEK